MGGAWTPDMDRCTREVTYAEAGGMARVTMGDQYIYGPVGKNGEYLEFGCSKVDGEERLVAWRDMIDDNQGYYNPKDAYEMTFLDENYAPRTVVIEGQALWAPIGVYKAGERYVVHSTNRHGPDDMYQVAVIDKDGKTVEGGRPGQLLWLDDKGVGVVYHDEFWTEDDKGFDRHAVDGTLSVVNFATGNTLGEVNIGDAHVEVGQDGRIYAMIYGEDDKLQLVRGGVGKDRLKFEKVGKLSDWVAVDGYFKIDYFFRVLEDGSIGTFISPDGRKLSGVANAGENNSVLYAVVTESGETHLINWRGNDFWEENDLRRNSMKGDRFNLTYAYRDFMVPTPLGQTGLFENEVFIGSAESLVVVDGSSLVITSPDGQRYEVIVGVQPDSSGWRRGIDRYRREAQEEQEKMYVRFGAGGEVEIGSMTAAENGVEGSVKLVATVVKKLK